MTLYSNGCQKCLILKSKLEDKGIEFEKSDDLNVIIENGFRTVPVLEVEGEFMGFADAVRWVNEKINSN